MNKLTLNIESHPPHIYLFWERLFPIELVNWRVEVSSSNEFLCIIFIYVLTRCTNVSY